MLEQTASYSALIYNVIRLQIIEHDQDRVHCIYSSLLYIIFSHVLTIGYFWYFQRRSKSRQIKEKTKKNNVKNMKNCIFR